MSCPRQTLCIPCSNRFRKGEFCPSCLVVYHSDDDDLPMVCCDTCERWIHAECDNLDEDAYEALTDDDGTLQPRACTLPQLTVATSLPLYCER